MYIKNSLKLFINHLSLGCKSLLYRFCILIVFVLAVYILGRSAVNSIVQSDAFVGFKDSFVMLWKQFMSGEFSNPTYLKNSINKFGILLSTNAPRIAVTIIVIVLLIFLMEVLFGLADYVTTVIIDDYMKSITKSRFVITFFENFKKAVPFELIYAAIKLLFSFMSITLASYLIVWTIDYLSFIAIGGAIVFLFAFFSLFFTITARLRTEYLHTKSLKQAFKTLIVPKKCFAYAYTSFLLSIVAFIYLNISMFLVTFAAGIVVTIPMTFLFFSCLRLVIDYTVTENKYYIDYDNIVLPTKDRGGAKYLSDIDL